MKTNPHLYLSSYIKLKVKFYTKLNNVYHVERSEVGTTQIIYVTAMFTRS